MDERAYTYVDRTHAVVGNHWMERTWSAFLGNTYSLLQKHCEIEWITGPSSEFEIRDENRSFDMMDFGEVIWSEENSSIGATLVCRQQHPDLEVCIKTLAYHKNPGMRRRVSVRNRSDKEIIIRRVTLERLPISPDGVTVLTDGFEQPQNAVDFDTLERGIALAREDGRGIITGIDGGGHYSAFSRPCECCCLALLGPTCVAPGEVWKLPATYILPYAGDLTETVRTTYAQLLMHLRKQSRARDHVGEDFSSDE